MLYYNFQNYEGFKERFGVKGDKDCPRKNKLVLAYIKQPELLAEARRTGNYDKLNITSMSTVENLVWKKINNQLYKFKTSTNYSYEELNLCGFIWASKKYRLDERMGFCEDGDARCIRVYNIAEKKIKKIRAGRLLASLLDEYGVTFPEPIKLWLCEEFTRKWEAHTAAFKIDPYHLVIDNDFEAIYSSRRLDGTFGSCMTDKGYWKFYRDAVKARAAYLERDSDGVILARCIIYTDVYDEDGVRYRLAERQYAPTKKFGNSCDDDEITSKNDTYNSVMKRILVNELIKGGHIDGYKKVGAGCGENNAFVGVNGEDLSVKEFSIACELDRGDCLSYQDSFAYYNEDEREAYNFEADGCVCDDDDEYEVLKVTNGKFLKKRNYDEYHEEETDEDVIRVHYNGEWITTEDSDWGLEDFHEINGDYYHEDECVRCPYCGDWMLQDDDNYYSELTGDSYCCESCMDDAEEEWRNENMYYSEFDEDWTDDEDEVTTFVSWNAYLGDGGYHYRQSIFVESLNRLIEKGEVILCNGVWYELPYTRVWQNNESFTCVERIYND